MSDYKVGQRVSKSFKVTAGPNRGQLHTEYGTVAYVKPDRIGVKWDARHGVTFPALRTDVTPA